MVSRVAILFVGILIGYSIAYFHVSVDPKAFEAANARSSKVESIASNNPGQNKAKTAGIQTLEQELNKFVSEQDWKEVISLGKAGLKIQPDYKDALSPILHNAYSKLAMKAFDDQDFDGVVSLFNESRTFKDLSGKELQTLAKSHLSLNNYEKAKKTISAAEKKPDSKPLEIKTLQRTIVNKELASFISKQKIDDAVHLLELELIGDASHSPYYLTLAELNYQQKDYQKTLNNFDSAQELGEELNKTQKKLYKMAKRRLDSPNLVEVPLTIEGNNLYVNAVLNNAQTPLRFVVDTGATYTTLSNRAAESLGLNPTLETEAITVVTANGPVSATKFLLENISVGDASVDEVDAIILDSLDSNIDGLLGLSFLQQFRVEIASDENLLILKPR